MILFTEPKDGAIIHLHLKFKYYDMILSGEKKEEYRAIKPYYEKMFDKMRYQDYEKKVYACFWKGYTKEHFYCEIIGIKAGFPNPKWSDPKTIENKICHIFKLDN